MKKQKIDQLVEEEQRYWNQVSKCLTLSLTLQFTFIKFRLICNELYTYLTNPFH